MPNTRSSTLTITGNNMVDAAARGLPPLTLHNFARITISEPLTIETPAAQWAYAAHFTIDPPVVGQGTVAVAPHVRQCEIGVGLLNQDESQFHVERQMASDDGPATVELMLASGQESTRLVLRNTGGSGHPAVVVVRKVTTSAAGAEPPQQRIPVIHLFSRVFRPFRAFSGRVPPGYWVNWLGVLTRAHVWPFPAEIRAVYGTERDEEWVARSATSTSSTGCRYSRRSTRQRARSGWWRWVLDGAAG